MYMPAPLKIQAGDRYGRLCAVEELPQARTSAGRSKRLFLWRCDCGEEKAIPLVNVTTGKSTSCGCWQKEWTKKKHTKHGMTNSKEYYTYKSAKNRCTNANDAHYEYYGGRGIEFRFNSFKEFYDELGDKPEGMTLDRIDTNGHYERGNVRWATRQQQSLNRRHWSNSRYRGVTSSGKKWRAEIQKDGKRYILGSFNTDDDAALAYDEKAKELYGNDALLNFPQDL